MSRDKSDGSLSSSGLTLLMVSVYDASRGNPDIVRALCSAGGQEYILKTCAERQQTALHYAVASGREEAALALLEFGGQELGLKQDRLGRTCLHLAAELADTSPRFIHLLVEQGGGQELLLACTKDEGKLTCMHYAAQDGRLQSLVALCELGGRDLWLKTNSIGQTALFTACAFGHWELIKELLERGGSELWMKAEENPMGHYCLHYAIEFKRVEVVKLLCERAPSLMSTSYSKGKTLTVAVQKACTEIKALEFTELCTGAAVKIHSLKSECNDLLGEVEGRMQ